MRDFNGCVMRDTDGVILYEECSDIPEPEPPITVVKYGYLYNWYAATDVREICAAGWHVATNADFLNLVAETVGEWVSGGNELKEVGTTYWTLNIGATNSLQFNARGAAYRDHLGDFSVALKSTNWFHSSDDYFADIWTPNGLYLNPSDGEMGQTGGSGTPEIETAFGMSVRPVKDSTILTHGQTGTYVGNDGKVYRTICIGAQEWLADNLCETLYRDGSPIPEVTDAATWAALTTGARCSYDNDESNAFTI